MTEIPQLLQTAQAAARRGGAVLMEWFGKSDLVMETKAQNDYVSEADRSAERAVLQQIERDFPDHQILAEESAGDVVSAHPEGYQWVVDPLDGTANFLHGLEIFSVSVACMDRGQPVAAAVYHPVVDQMFAAGRGTGTTRNGEPVSMRSALRLSDAFLATGFPFRMHRAIDLYLELFKRHFGACRGIRRCGSAALDLAHVAAGIYDGFFEFQLAPWDVAAGVLLIQEAGGLVTDLDGNAGMPWAGNIVCGSPTVHAEMLEIVRSLTSETHLTRLLA